MKPRHFIYLFPLLFALILLLSSPPFASTTLIGAAELGEAAPGESMWVLLNHVKPDKRAQFEEYVYDIFLPALEKVAQSDAVRRTIRDQTRMLEPEQANEDGSYTYIWLMDPLVKDADYTYKSILGQVYTSEETEKYLSMVTECLTVPQVAHRVKESSRW